MRRKVSAWPVGIIGNILLFTVFLGGAFPTPQDLDLWGQAGRQVFFLIVSVYGWVRWYRYRKPPARERSGSSRAGRPAGRVLLLVGGRRAVDSPTSC